MRENLLRAGDRISGKKIPILYIEITTIFFIKILNIKVVHSLQRASTFMEKTNWKKLGRRLSSKNANFESATANRPKFPLWPVTPKIPWNLAARLSLVEGRMEKQSDPLSATVPRISNRVFVIRP